VPFDEFSREVLVIVLIPLGFITRVAVFVAVRKKSINREPPDSLFVFQLVQ
jgi:hypothetical protein